jgi:hypothetical protein
LTFKSNGVILGTTTWRDDGAQPADGLNLKNKLYLPLIMRGGGPNGPDLTVQFHLIPNQTSFVDGDTVSIEVVVTNNGTQPAGEFWVDLYINPSETPAVNARWNDLCTLDPCYGLTWAVDQDLAPGESVTLSSDSFSELQSYWLDTLAAGTTDIYVLADSWNPASSTGAVAESNENNNLAALHGLSVAEGAAKVLIAPTIAPRPPLR